MAAGKQDAHRKSLEAVRAVSQQLLQSAPSPADFFRRLLPNVVDGAGLQAAAVWMYDDHHRLRLVAEHELSSMSSTGQFFVDQEHQAAVGDVMEQIKVRVLPNRSDAAEGIRAHSLAIGPIVRNDRGVGAIEVYTDPEDDADQPTFLHELIDLLSGYGSKAISRPGAATVPTDSSIEPAITPADHVPANETPVNWEQFDRFLLGLRRLDVKDLAANAANDGRLLLGCDRVSIAVREGRRVRIKAVSGQENVHQRANLIRTMTRLTERVMQGRERVVYAGRGDDFPPPLEKPLADYLAESRMRMVAMIPLVDPRRRRKTEENEHPSPRQERRAIVGCLIVEQATESEPQVGLLDRAELIAPHVASAISDAEQHESILLLPLWRLLGRGLRWFRGRRLLAAIAILIALGGLGAGLAYLPWTYRVAGTGTAMPVTQHEVYAPENGEVLEIRVKSGDQVQAGDPLIVLRNPELHAELVSVRAAVEEKSKLVEALGDQANEAGNKGATDEQIRFLGEEARARTEVDGLRIRLEVLEEREAKLTVRAPARGTVATFQVDQLLRDRPVQRGEKLLEVMDPAGDWRLELEIPEHRMGHLLTAIQKSPKQSLPVEYVLATAVEKTLTAELQAADIATRSNTSETEGSIVEVYARINPDDLPGRRIGAEVTARVDCGEKSLFYVLFGDVVEFVQRNVWW